ncbi:FeMo cofactor biosynthesis protein NifB [Methanimicrococcus hongohii]|uniref:FeMo cofactor biosynthesis protein NifB n=1 Tax=Methanimicrococcus hongohii TaxID=3028295 RepID=A0AA96ZSE1_9EURY|nr:nitrogenase cofactor biosynthesis protein NifB [Methanimicrococcus sp. Hf6]WNY23329.1 FeMo cofactor biosynthesis protein NifB [Methanimicrococcus sp. Hf6]
MKECMSDEMKRKISEHPCYSPEAQHKFGRLHLAVAPSCNIQCNYCDRKFDCVNESRPGVTSEVLSPTDALAKTAQILREHPYIRVVGIAGPGDPLDNDATFETFRLIRENFPDITLCISTNGLLLPDRFDELAESKVETLTVTLNAIDPDIQKEIISMIYYNGKKYSGREAAEILIQNQLEGIKKAVAAGMTVKINTVLIPGINDKHIIEIAKKMNETGVYIMNVMPLINQAAFADIVPPTDAERKAVQDACAPYVKQMKHCRQCRSDAYGLIGKDLSIEKKSCGKTSVSELNELKTVSVKKGGKN